MLDKILEHKREEIAAAKKKYKVEDLQSFAQEQGGTRGFVSALKSRVDNKNNAIIAEIKRASPSKGVLCENFEPLNIANTYMRGGAQCLSVLTDVHFFKGSGAILDLVRRHCMLPVLRKDFIVDPYQIYESRAIGADCVLLIAAAIPDDGLLNELFAMVNSMSMDVLFEAHNQEELERGLQLGEELKMIGINNRDLTTFEVSLDTSVDLAKYIPQDKIIISESGIAHDHDISKLRNSGIYAYLIGETLIKSKDVSATLSELLAAE